MDIKLGREKENKTQHHVRRKEHERKSKKKVETKKRKVIACKQKEGGLVADVKQDCRLIPENKGRTLGSFC